MDTKQELSMEEMMELSKKVKEWNEKDYICSGSINIFIIELTGTAGGTNIEPKASIQVYSTLFNPPRSLGYANHTTISPIYRSAQKLAQDKQKKLLSKSYDLARKLIE